MVKETLTATAIQKIEDLATEIGKDAGLKAFDHVALDRAEWIANAVYQRIRRAKDEVIEKILDPNYEHCYIDKTLKQKVLEDMIARGDDPMGDSRRWSEATKDEIIQYATVKTAKQIQAEAEAAMK